MLKASWVEKKIYSFLSFFFEKSKKLATFPWKIDFTNRRKNDQEKHQQENVFVIKMNGSMQKFEEFGWTNIVKNDEN